MRFVTLTLNLSILSLGVLFANEILPEEKNTSSQCHSSNPPDLSALQQPFTVETADSLSKNDFQSEKTISEEDFRNNFLYGVFSLNSLFS